MAASALGGTTINAFAGEALVRAGLTAPVRSGLTALAGADLTALARAGLAALVNAVSIWRWLHCGYYLVVAHCESCKKLPNFSYDSVGTAVFPAKHGSTADLVQVLEGEKGI